MFGQGQPDKETWLREAEKAYEKVFGQRDRMPKPGRPKTFTELEEEAVQAGNQLARWILEAEITAETEGTGCDGENWPCPHCGKPAQRMRGEGERRELRSRPGGVSVRRCEYYCGSCRKSFFPSRLPARPQG